MTMTTDPYDALGPLYDEWVISVTEDVPFYRAIAREAAARRGTDRAVVLELGAGSGRVTMPLLGDGHLVTALDVAVLQLQRLAALAADQRPAGTLTTRPGDMRALREVLPPTAGGSYDLVIAPFRALMHVVGDVDDVLADVAWLLAPGGQLAFDVAHADGANPDVLAEGWQLRRRVTGLESPEGDWAIWERATFTDDGASLQLDIRCDRTDAAGRGTSVASSMVLELPPPHLWRDAITRAGLELESTWGWFDGTPFEPGMSDSIWVARKPA